MTKCSEIKGGGTSFYNIYSCASINESRDEVFDTQICLSISTDQSCSFEKYCFWDPKSYTCDILAIGVSNPSSYTVSDGHGGSSTENVCASKKLTYNICKNTYSKAVCLEVVSASCFFDLAQGGCNDINSKEKTVPTCSSANYQSCLKVTNPLA